MPSSSPTAVVFSDFLVAAGDKISEELLRLCCDFVADLVYTRSEDWATFLQYIIPLHLTFLNLSPHILLLAILDCVRTPLPKASRKITLELDTLFKYLQDFLLMNWQTLTTITSNTRH